MTRITGNYQQVTTAGEEVRAFVPFPLPPADPPLELAGEASEALDRARTVLGQLELAAELVPPLEWFVYAYVRKEAVLSSQVEGTQATLLDLFSHEADVSPEGANADVEEVGNYLDALAYARDEMSRNGGLPLSMRLLHQAHRRLMRGVRGATKLPGEIRRSQNWVGGTRPGNAAFVPPPPHLLPELLARLENYIHGSDPRRDGGLPPLVRIALVHVQFETLHPYLDGNGRIGRLLITLMLEQYRLLSRPLLYLSLYFKRHRREYYRRLDGVRQGGDWEGWVTFFLEGVAAVAEEATDTVRDLMARVSTDRMRVLQSSSTTLPALRLVEQLPRHPVVTIARAAELLGTTRPTAAKAVEILHNLEVLVETTGGKRDRIFCYQQYVERLRQGTELEA
jgi:Fic family protein